MLLWAMSFSIKIKLRRITYFLTDDDCRIAIEKFNKYFLNKSKMKLFDFRFLIYNIITLF